MRKLVSAVAFKSLTSFKWECKNRDLLADAAAAPKASLSPPPLSLSLSVCLHVFVYGCFASDFE